MKVDNVKIGVIAGTPVDTQMGVDFIKSKGYDSHGIATATNPEEQNRLQFLDPETLTEKVSSIIGDLGKAGIYKTMIYCNSLSSAIDIELIRKKNSKNRIVTPLDVYRNISAVYNKVVLWAANAQCLAGIERIFYEKNASIDIIGISMLPVIKSIEEQNSIDTIYDNFDLIALCQEYYKPEALILGCTHLPYLLPSLSEKVDIPIIDPAEKMLEYLI